MAHPHAGTEVRVVLDILITKVSPRPQPQPLTNEEKSAQGNALPRPGSDLSLSPTQNKIGHWEYLIRINPIDL